MVGKKLKNYPGILEMLSQNFWFEKRGMEAKDECFQAPIIYYEKNEIIVGAGASQVIFNAFAVTINEGDEIIAPKPYWVSYPEFVKICGGKAVYLDCTDDGNFNFNIDELSKNVSKKTKWLILNSPSNPTGKILTHNELEKIGKILRSLHKSATDSSKTGKMLFI